ncbi:MAG: GSCFA domain-containing protein [Flavobacteriaceae bacterium]|nr:GSCFA domain-containing protein [Flavobacteriaceae bacterium]
MNFNTKIQLSSSPHPIDYHSKIICLGSCFAVNIGLKFNYFKFENTVNPFGILFHPLAIEKLISKAINQDSITKKDLFFHNEQWHSFDVHSALSQTDESQFLVHLNRLLTKTRTEIKTATHLFITLGTAWVYRHLESDEIVANCHKIPQKAFRKELLSVEQIQLSLISILHQIRSINPNVKVIFTVSPVRHLKDGFVENQRSKAHLITALHQTTDTSSNGNWGEATYFPAYEIVMDELRDYRFYAEDMIHPNQIAIDYIWKRFRETQISPTAYPVMNEVENIQKALAHKPFDIHSSKHQQFLSDLNKQITVLKEQFPIMVF